LSPVDDDIHQQVEVRLHPVQVGSHYP
jgi:hypothetical protein